MSVVTRLRRGHAIWIVASVTLLALIAGIVTVAMSGSADPTESATAQSRGVIVVNSAVIVFREGLEAILIFAAVTAAMLGAQRGLRRHVAAGAAVAGVATVATWFVAQAILGQFSRHQDQVQAFTGLLAVAVLLVIMNWFFHRIYWTEWIGKRTEQRKRVLSGGFLGGQTLGLLLLGFTSVYREGFETVLFLQALDVKAGGTTVLLGVALGLAGTAAVGVVTFFLQQRLPYRRMLVVTGALLGIVLVVMVGGSARTLQDLGWISRTELPFGFPDWLARWFELVPTYETVAAQGIALVLVLGSYVVARHLKVGRPRKRGEQPAARPSKPPLTA